MSKNKLSVYVLVDRTGSMSSGWSETISALNRFVSDAFEDKANETSVSISFFDSYGNDPVLQKRGTFFSREAWHELSATDKTISPRGNTPLYDAVGLAYQEIDRNHKAGDKVQFVVLTDGQENCSREFKLDMVKQYLKDAQAKEWLVTFLAANLESFSGGLNTGFTFDSSIQYDPKNVFATMNAATNLRTSYASRGLVGTAFSDADRAEATK